MWRRKVVLFSMFYQPYQVTIPRRLFHFLLQAMERSSEARTGTDSQQEGSARHDAAVDDGIIDDAIISAAVRSIDGTQDDQENLLEFQQYAATVQASFGRRLSIHCIATCESRDGGNVQGEHVFPIYSPMLQTALNTTSSGSLSDVFSMAKQVSISAIRNAGVTQEREEASNTRTENTPSEPSVPFELPDWFPASGLPVLQLDVLPQAASSENGVYIFRDNEVMSKLMHLEARHVADAYGEFFNILHKKAVAGNEIAGRMLYNLFTPPWLRHPSVTVMAANIGTFEAAASRI